MKEKTKITAVVVTYNRKYNLIKCIKSLLNQTIKINKIIIVDNGSTDGTENILREHQYLAHETIYYYNTNINSGGAGGFKRGIELANEYEYDWVWLMDDDVEPEKECLKYLLSTQTNWDVRQPVRIYEDGEFVISESIDINLKNPFGPLKKSIIRNPPKKNTEKCITTFPFEGPLISKKVINSIGTPIAEYFIMCDDTEYSIRVKKNGYKTGFISNAIMKRQIKPSKLNNNLDWKFTYYIRNHFDIDKRHGSLSVKILRPILLAIYYTLTSIIHRRKFSDIKKPLSILIKK